MSTHVEKIRRHPAANGDLYVTREVRDDNSDMTTADGQVVAARTVNFVAGVLEVLLAFRFLLSLLGASTANGFANFIYSVSHPFVAPFFSLFSYSNYQYGVSRFEVYTLVAMAVYAIVAWGIIYLITLNRR